MSIWSSHGVAGEAVTGSNMVTGSEGGVEVFVEYHCSLGINFLWSHFIHHFNLLHTSVYHLVCSCGRSTLLANSMFIMYCDCVLLYMFYCLCCMVT